MAPPAKLSLGDLQKGLAKTPGRTEWGTIAGRALSGIDPRYLGGFDPVQYQSVFNNLYDNLANEIAMQDMNLNQMYSDYETQFGRLGEDEAEANRKLINAMANRGTLQSGEYLNQTEDIAGDYNRYRSDLGSTLNKGFTDAAGRRLQAIGGYNQGLAQQELGLGQSARSWSQNAIAAEAQARREEEYRQQQERANQALLAQQQAAIDQRMAAQAESDRQTREWQENFAAQQAEFDRQYAEAMAMNQAVNQPAYSGPPVASSPETWRVGQINPAIFSPTYSPQIKSNPATAPPMTSGSFSGYVPQYQAGRAGQPISPGYQPNTRGVNPRPLGRQIAV